MNTLVIVLIAAVVLACAYVFYGRWLANKWGIDPKAKTPAVELNDGKDFVPTNGWTVFSHQFSSIAGAGPVTGAIQAAAFGWLPVLLWVLIGGVFFALQIAAVEKWCADEDVILHTIYRDLDIIPSDLQLASVDLDADIDRKQAVRVYADLRDALVEDDAYDVLIFVCPPSFSLPCFSAIEASDTVIVPI